jgi:hypothetical protein
MKKALIIGALLLIAGVVLLGGCSGGSGTGTGSGLDEVDAFGVAFSEAFGSLGSQPGSQGCFSVTQTPIDSDTVQYEIEFDNCTFSEDGEVFSISGTIIMLYTDTENGFSIDFDGALDFTNLDFTAMTMDFTMTFNGSAYTYAGIITVDGDTLDIDQFLSVLQ